MSFIEATLEALPEFFSKYALHMILWCGVIALARIGDILVKIKEIIKENK